MVAMLFASILLQLLVPQGALGLRWPIRIGLAACETRFARYALDVCSTTMNG